MSLYFFLAFLFSIGNIIHSHDTGSGNVRASCHNDSSVGPQNLFPVDDSSPVLIRSVENGTLYQVGVGTNDDQIWLVHVWGMNGYDYGYAYGTLLAKQIIEFLPKVWKHFEEEVMDNLKDLHLPQWLEDLISDKGLAFALDVQAKVSEAYMDEELFNEMKGVADGAKADYAVIRRLHFIGEITRGRCSLYGLWGNATLGGKTLQLRALDWDINGGLQDYPVVTIYHPLSEKLGHAFANVAWAGYIGTLTGMSSTRLGISEIGVYFSDDTFGDESFFGIPFIFVERYILQHSNTLDDALSYIADVHRTCHLMLAVGDGNLGTARMIQYSHSKVNFFDDLNLEPLADWHPRIPNVIYEGMDWVCPSVQFKLYQQIIKNYGQITPEVSIRDITAVIESGDLHVAVYDLTDNIMYVSNARGTNEQGPLKAYERQFIKFDLNVEFARSKIVR